jgi:hypothetical protein
MEIWKVAQRINRSLPKRARAAAAASKPAGYQKYRVSLTGDHALAVLNRDLLQKEAVSCDPKQRPFRQIHRGLIGTPAKLVVGLYCIVRNDYIVEGSGRSAGKVKIGPFHGHEESPAE